MRRVWHVGQISLENQGTHPSRRRDKLKRVGRCLINWMFFIDSWRDRPVKRQRASCALCGLGLRQMAGIGFRPLRNLENPIRSCNRVENQSKACSHFQLHQIANSACSRLSPFFDEGVAYCYHFLLIIIDGNYAGTCIYIRQFVFGGCRNVSKYG